MSQAGYNIPAHIPPRFVGLRNDFIFTSYQMTTESGHQREIMRFLSGLGPGLCLVGCGILISYLQVVLPSGGCDRGSYLHAPHLREREKSVLRTMTHSFSLPCKFVAVD